MRGLGSINGVVKDSNHRPLADVNVVIETGPTHPDLAALTGPDGVFSFGSLRPGNYVLRAFGGAITGDAIEVPVFGGKTAFVEISVKSDVIDDTDDNGDIIDEN
jgi:hypothetical protein